MTKLKLIKMLTLGIGFKWLIGFTVLGRLTNTTGTGYAYDGVGNLQSVQYQQGITNGYQYDSQNRLTNLTWGWGGIPIASFAYQLGATGNRTNLTENVQGATRNYSWSYDRLYRLTNENISGLGGVNYAFDPVGNRTNQTSTLNPIASQNYGYNTNDGLNGDGYDPNGNTTSSAANSYQYDAENRLTNVNHGQIVLTYDSDGNRVSKTMAGVTTYYLMDDRNPTGYAQAVEEWTGSTLTSTYSYGLALISQTQANGISYFLADGHGSTRLLYNYTWVSTWTYDAYGNVIASTVLPPTTHLYCGEQYDSDLGFYYQRARYLNPTTGRFWTLDSYEGNNEDPLTLHKYLYCQGNPANGWDPSGHDGDIGSFSVASSISTTLSSIYNTAVLTAGNAMIHTIIGVQNNLTANQILGNFFLGTAEGLAVGLSVGVVANVAGDLVFGGTFEGELVNVEVNAQTVAASQEFALTESTTEGLLAAAARAAKAVKQSTGLQKGPAYGSKVHKAFAGEVTEMGLNSEVSYLNGKIVDYGTPGSVRIDVVKGDTLKPEAIWDLKTGSAKLTPERIQQIRSHLPRGYQDIPIAEIRP